MKRAISMIISCIFSVLVVSCNHTDTPLTKEEKEPIKFEVINSIENHVEDIINQDYDEVMRFYVKDDFILFGDGTYWGDYETVDEIWGNLAAPMEKNYKMGIKKS